MYVSICLSADCRTALNSWNAKLQLKENSLSTEITAVKSLNQKSTDHQAGITFDFFYIQNIVNYTCTVSETACKNSVAVPLATNGTPDCGSKRDNSKYFET